MKNKILSQIPLILIFSVIVFSALFQTNFINSLLIVLSTMVSIIVYSIIYIKKSIIIFLVKNILILFIMYFGLDYGYKVLYCYLNKTDEKVLLMINNTSLKYQRENLKNIIYDTSYMSRNIILEFNDKNYLKYKINKNYIYEIDRYTVKDSLYGI